MIKSLLTAGMIIAGMTAMGQKADSATTKAGAEDVYYSFDEGQVGVASNSSWDIALTTAGFDASILINEAAGVELYLYGTDVSAWSVVDTNGFEWKTINNSTESWSEGAFNVGSTGHPDYGWGTYNSGTHDINGNKLYIVKDRNDAYRQVVIEEMSAPGVFTIKVGDIGGDNTQTYTVNKKETGYVGKNFVHMDLSTGSVYSQEPDAEDWDVLFTKYVTLIPTGPGTFLPYAVSGVKVNKGVEVAERNGVDVESNDTSSLSWTTNITEIGSDWKSFNRGTMVYDMEPNRVYFVRTANGAVWKLYFTGYEGGAAGTSYFNVEKIKGTASVKESYVLNSKVYPNPASQSLNISNLEPETMEYRLVSIQGSTAVTGEVKAGLTAQVELGHLPKGVYIINLQTASASTTKQIVIR